MRRPAAWLIAVACAAFLVLLLVSVLVLPRLLYPPLPAADLRQVADPQRRIELRQAQDQLQNDARGILLQAFGGLLLIGGALATWRQVHVNRQGQLTERFTRAIDQLGSDTLDVRVGGIYALERIARNSYEDRPTITAILETFVRTHSAWRVGAPGGPVHPTPAVEEQLPWLHTRAPDVQAAMSVLARRPESRDEAPLYFSYVDLRRAYLRRGNFARMECRHANLARAVIRDAALDRADLRDADLRQASMRDSSFTNASLRDCYLQGADLRGADLRGADLRGAHLDGARLAGAHADATTKWPTGFDTGRLAYSPAAPAGPTART